MVDSRLDQTRTLLNSRREPPRPHRPRMTRARSATGRLGENKNSDTVYPFRAAETPDPQRCMPDDFPRKAGNTGLQTFEFGTVLFANPQPARNQCRRGALSSLGNVVLGNKS